MKTVVTFCKCRPGRRATVHQEPAPDADAAGGGALLSSVLRDVGRKVSKGRPLVIAVDAIDEAEPAGAGKRAVASPLAAGARLCRTHQQASSRSGFDVCIRAASNTGTI
jgi:hypothetical protein